MRRVERISISSKNFIEGSDTAGKRMAAHLDRREQGRRVILENETIERLTEEVIVIPRERTIREGERSSSSKKIKSTSSYPLGWILIKRY